MEKITYTTILHQARERLEITTNEYCIADIIYHLSNNPKSKVSGWCYASKKTIGEFIGVSERSVLTIIKKLIEKNIISKDEETKYLKTTEKWYNTVILNKLKILGEESSPTPKKVRSQGEESSVHTPKKVRSHTEESSYNNNNNNNKDNNNNNNLQPGGCSPKKVPSSLAEGSIKRPKLDHREIVDYIKLFEGINPTISYDNKTTRSAVELLYRKFGKEEAISIAKYAVSVFGKKFAPVISTPYQLKEKISSLASYKMSNTRKVVTKV